MAAGALRRGAGPLPRLLVPAAFRGDCRGRCRWFAAVGFERNYEGLWANTTFEELGVHPALIRALAAQKIVRPTVVQAEAFRPLVKGQDCVLRAETGSGKTLAYLLPLVNRVYHLHDRSRQVAAQDPNAPNPLLSSRPWVVLVPTSDLCAQVLAMLEAIDADRLVSSQSLQRLFKWEALGGQHGFQAPGLKERTQLGPGAPGARGAAASPSPSYTLASPRIRWGAVDLVVSTPSKFCEDLQQFKEDNLYPACIVLDEADALFQGPNRGYLFDIFGALRPRPRIRQIDEPRSRLPDMIPTQFIFAAATLLHIGPFSAGNMIIERFCTAHTVETKQFHRLPTGIVPESIRWRAGSDSWEDRVDQLMEVLRETPCEKTLVFVNSLHNCHILLKFLKEGGWPVVSYMKGRLGRMGPRFRDAQKFVDGEASIMVATEFGGRGLDWHEVDHVINFQLPTSAVCWLHRVGRTGRMGRTGLVTNLVGTKDRSLAEMIQTRLDSGKDLHGAFSRRRSLPRRIKREREAADEEDDPDGAVASGDGAYRLDGGLELLQRPGADGSAGSLQFEEGAGREGTVIGFLDAARADEEHAGAVGRRLRQQARETTARRSSRDGEARGGGEDAALARDETLVRLREELLASDSDSEAEGGVAEEDEDDGDRGLNDDGRAVSGRRLGLAGPAAPFDWGSLDAGEGAALAPAPGRQLFDVGKDREGRRDARRYSRAEVPAGSRGAPRRGVRETNRIAAGRNYASPDDELLL